MDMHISCAGILGIASTVPAVSAKLSPCMRRSLALVFDLDGVIVDSMPLHTEVWKLYLHRNGIDSEGIETRMHGKRNDEIVRELFGDSLTAEEVFVHGAAKEALWRTVMGSRLGDAVLPGLYDFLQGRRGTPMAIASNAEPANVDFVLDGLALRGYFPVVIDGHQVTRPKPHPDIYLLAAERLNVDSRDCVVFEDSPAGIAAAKAAGARVVVVNTSRVELPRTDFMVQDFRDPELESWLSDLESRLPQPSA